jgi:hypothetical protein
MYKSRRANRKTRMNRKASRKSNRKTHRKSRKTSRKSRSNTRRFFGGFFQRVPGSSTPFIRPSTPPMPRPTPSITASKAPSVAFTQTGAPATVAKSTIVTTNTNAGAPVVAAGPATGRMGSGISMNLSPVAAQTVNRVAEVENDYERVGNTSSTPGMTGPGPQLRSAGEEMS